MGELSTFLSSKLRSEKDIKAEVDKSWWKLLTYLSLLENVASIKFGVNVPNLKKNINNSEDDIRKIISDYYRNNSQFNTEMQLELLLTMAKISIATYESNGKMSQ